MRIVFIGAVDFSKHCLATLIGHQANIVGIFTPKIKKTPFNTDFADLGPIAKKNEIPITYVQNINAPQTIACIRDLHPDVIFVFGFSQLISQNILAIPSKGCIGTHPALLPYNRGRHPLIWAIIEKLEETGLTFFYLDQNADSGDILWQKAFPITHLDDAGTLYTKIKKMASLAISEFLPALQKGTAQRIPQDHNQATYWRKRSKIDGQINWSDTTCTINNLTRALTHPYAGAHTFFKGREAKIWKSKRPKDTLPNHCADLQPGTVLDANESKISVKTGDNYLEILMWENLENIQKGNMLDSTEPQKDRTNGNELA